jgi:Molecular chaperone (small heat shock protein)
MATINVEVQATIRRPLAVVSRQFGDMRHHERHRVHPDISLTVLSEDGDDCRFRQEIRLLGMLQSDEIVQHRNVDGSLFSEVVAGVNKGLRIYQKFSSVGADSTRVTFPCRSSRHRHQAFAQAAVRNGHSQGGQKGSGGGSRRPRGAGVRRRASLKAGSRGLPLLRLNRASLPTSNPVQETTMPSRNPTDLMWAQAFDLIEQAERIHRQFFRLTASARPHAVWEPPVDVFEDDREVVIVVALPGVAPERIEVSTEATTLVVRAECPLPFAGSRRAVRRLEIPYGYFERRIPLPDARLEAGTRESSDGLLIVRLRKTAYTGPL